MLALQYGSTLLRQDLDRIPLWRLPASGGQAGGNHVAVKQIIEDFAQYLYLQRLRDPDVLLNAIRDGVNLMTWPTDSFGYAEGWDEGKKRYVGLQAGRLVAIGRDSPGLLVKPDAGTLSKEVVEHLTSQPGAEVEITLEIQAQVPSGIPEKTVRDVSENCRTLKFKTFEFEKES